MVQRVNAASPSTHRSTPAWSWSAVADLIRLRNQSGTWLLLLPSLWSLVLANQGRPPMWLLGVFTLGAFVMRSLGVVFNDLADRNFDKHVARTRTRPLAAGRLAPRQALLVALGLAVIAAALVITLNPFTMLLSPIALFLAAIYPFSKRWIQIPQGVLGIAFGLKVGMVGTANSSSPIFSPPGPVSFMSREMVLKISSSLKVPISSLLERSLGFGSVMDDQLNPSFCLPFSPWQCMQ
ncbi:MAG: hypothetical protein E8D43_11190 [Nitrospira sp.]|nr:MAG: hypothetical protein E8D43_11190 [Nitrospira sp.]